MKALRISRLCVVVALMLGLFIPWSAASPQLISGERFVGSDIGCDCSVTTGETCDSTEGKTCNDDFEECDDSGDGTCERLGASSCYLRTACENQADEMCN